MTFEILFPEPFKKKLKKLKKKYPRVTNDLATLLEQLQEGKNPGDSIPGLENLVYKARVASSDLKKGKSGSFRVIYYLTVPNRRIFLLTIYVKAHKENIQVGEIVKILEELALK